MPYLLFLKKRQNLKLSSAANYIITNIDLKSEVNFFDLIVYLQEHCTSIWENLVNGLMFLFL